MDLSTKIAVTTSTLLAISELLPAVKKDVIEANSLYEVIRNLCKSKALTVPQQNPPKSPESDC